MRAITELNRAVAAATAASTFVLPRLETAADCLAAWYCETAHQGPPIRDLLRSSKLVDLYRYVRCLCVLRQRSARWSRQ